ncbi:MAG: hypothetical protein EOP45_11865 [Sphingobacteriaceae bacterium]|nr:MAG: hypothetical protein EOP45_11865 [Sphingobacteriaceae bacterium]
MQLVAAHHIISIINQAKNLPSEALESELIEFKAYANLQSLNNSKELAEEIVAFANLNGGSIIIGIKDDSDVKYGAWNSQLVGFELGDVSEIKSRIIGKIQTPIKLEVEYLLFENKNYLIINVAKSREVLVTTTSGKVCVRDERSSRPMNPGEIEAKVKAFQRYDWTGESLELDLYSSLDEQALEEALNDHCQRRGLQDKLSATAFLEAIEATKNGYLTRAGLLFLGKQEVIKKVLGDYEYRFSWKEKGGGLAVNDVWSGCMWNAISRIKRHFTHCNRPLTFAYDGKEYNLHSMDEVAFHEAYINALVHRDYTVDGMISVNFSGNKLLITSPGRFYGGITTENIGLHEPRHRNKALARILMTFHLVDRAGMGVPRMGLRSLMYGRKFPVFREDYDSVEVAMDAEYFIAPIFVITANNHLTLDLPELLILNLIYERGYLPMKELLQKIKSIVDDPWETVLGIVDSNVMSRYVELCGDKKDIYLRVKEDWRDYFKVGRPFKTHATSERYVNLYKYLRKYKEGGNSELIDVTGYKHASKVSSFLRECEFVKKRNGNTNSTWILLEPSHTNSHKRNT